MKAYLDNAATTKPSDAAVKAATDAMTMYFGNPSSLHNIGVDAEKLMTSARKSIAAVVAAAPENVIFTSGATESNNMAILGSARTYGKRRRKIVTTTIEHPSVAEPIKSLEEQGYEVVRIAPDRDGVINAEDIVAAVDQDTFMVSCMLVNNETGYILPVKRAFMAIKRNFPECITHSDCTQGFLKIPFKMAEICADMVSVSAHKVHGVKGTGALILSKGTRLLPITFGGGQEKGIRSGTESVPLISAFGAVCEEFRPTLGQATSNAAEMNAYIRKKLSKLDGISVNSGKEGFSPFIINISVDGIRSEIMLHFLESKDVYVSSGSACSVGKKSSVLKEFGLDDKRIDSAIRISISRYTTWKDIDMLINGIVDGQQSISR